MFQLKNMGAFCRHYTFYFIGIGGIGMSGLALLLLEQGHHVAGSDLKESALTRRLADLGATIYVGHDQKHLEKADFVVVSSAIDWQNPEIIKAQSLRIPLIKRGRLLADLMQYSYGISVAGTHGKTTTSSLLSHVFLNAKQAPTYVIGGCLNDTHRNAVVGESPYLICEADESDNSFIELSSVVAVVTNIDADHMETFGGEMSCLEDAFLAYCNKVPYNGVVVLGIDDPKVRTLAERYQGQTISYATDQAADIMARNIVQSGMITTFDVYCEKYNVAFSCSLPLPGKHNVQNALACIAVCLYEQLPLSLIQEGLKSFPGVGRRAQLISNTLFEQPITVLDDYGHHPCEIAATYKALKTAWPDKRLIWVFQPHRYSRTKFQFSAYVDCLSEIEHLVLLDVFPAGEQPIDGASSQDLALAIQQVGEHIPLVWNKAALNSKLKQIVEPGDVVVFQGAGSVSAWARELLECQIKVA